MEKTTGSTGTLYWYMTSGIVAESDLSGSLKSEYMFFDGRRTARRDFPGGAVSFYFSDELKTTDIVTDAQGNIKNESDFYPWGGELQFANSDSNHYKFAGKERDQETGVDYFGARYYSNGLGRFITADWAEKAAAVPYAEFADPQSLNLYTYVRNIPTTHVDPDGHFLDDCNACNHGDSGFSVAPVAGTEVGLILCSSCTPGQPLGSSQTSQSAQNKTEQQQQLTYKTIKGGQKARTWVIQWKLSQKSKNGGWIVQHVTTTDKSGKQSLNFWEAWQVPAKSQFTIYYPDPADDTFKGGTLVPSGTDVRAEARFFEGLQLPSSFTPNNPDTKVSGILPATTVDPHLSTKNATEPVDRDWTVP